MWESNITLFSFPQFSFPKTPCFIRGQRKGIFSMSSNARKVRPQLPDRSRRSLTQVILSRAKSKTKTATRSGPRRCGVFRGRAAPGSRDAVERPRFSSRHSGFSRCRKGLRESTCGNRAHRRPRRGGKNSPRPLTRIDKYG